MSQENVEIVREVMQLLGVARDPESALRDHTQNVREIFDALLKAEKPAPSGPLPRDFDEHAAEWNSLLAGHSFTDLEKSFRLLQTFALGPGYVHVSPRTTDLAMQLLPRFFALCPKKNSRGKIAMPKDALSDPDRVLVRLLRPRLVNSRGFFFALCCEK